MKQWKIDMVIEVPDSWNSVYLSNLLDQMFLDHVMEEGSVVAGGVMPHADTMYFAIEGDELILYVGDDRLYAWNRHHVANDMKNFTWEVAYMLLLSLTSTADTMRAQVESAKRGGVREQG